MGGPCPAPALQNPASVFPLMWRAEAGEGKARSGCGGGSRNDAVADGIQDQLQEAVEIAPGQALPANEVSSASIMAGRRPSGLYKHVLFETVHKTGLTIPDNAIKVECVFEWYSWSGSSKGCDSLF